MNIHCSNCEKDSGIESSAGGESGRGVGNDMAQAQDKLGWIPKNLILYTKHNDIIITCSPHCYREKRDEIFASRNVSIETVERVGAMLEESKKKIPKMTEETCAFLQKVSALLRKNPVKKE